MRDGEFPDGAHVLRARIDMASPNINMRDPTLYRIRHATHHRTGDAWCIYPTYDYAHPISDAIEGITHSLCTLEFEDHRPLYDWVVDNIRHDAAFRSRPQQIEFARLNLNYTVMSKRKLLALVERKLVTGWDDPRMPTIAGLRRRGYTPEAIRDFCARIGVAKKENVIDVALLEHTVREDLNRRAQRALAVLRPLQVVIENYPEDRVETVEAVNNPEDASAGTRQIPFSRVLYIERDDFMEVPPKKFFRLSPGAEVRLRYAYILKCERRRQGRGRRDRRAALHDRSRVACRRHGGAPRQGDDSLGVGRARARRRSAAVRPAVRVGGPVRRRARSADRSQSRTRSKSLRGCKVEPALGAGAAVAAVSVRAAGLLLRRSGFAPRRAGVQPHGDAEGHLGEDRRTRLNSRTQAGPRDVQR